MLHRSVHAKLRWASTGIGRQLSPGSRRQLFSAAGLDHAAKSEAWREHGLSRFWIPTGGVTSSLDGKQGMIMSSSNKSSLIICEDDATALLVKAGFIRQAHSGIYHLLPLAQKLQNDLEGKLSWHLERYLGRLWKADLAFINTNIVQGPQKCLCRHCRARSYGEEVGALVRSP